MRRSLLAVMGMPYVQVGGLVSRLWVKEEGSCHIYSSATELRITKHGSRFSTNTAPLVGSMVVREAISSAAPRIPTRSCSSLSGRILRRPVGLPNRRIYEKRCSGLGLLIGLTSTSW